MYAAKFAEAVYVLHCFQKKTQATNRRDKAICAGALSRRSQGEKGLRNKDRHCSASRDQSRREPLSGARLSARLGEAPARPIAKHINDTRHLKRQLMDELSTWITEHRLKQSEAAEILLGPGSLTFPTKLRFGKSRVRDDSDFSAPMPT